MKIITSFLLLSILIVGSASTIKTEYQLFPTNLRITVLNNLGNFEEGATVVIFDNEEDYKVEKNAVAGPNLTDRKGRVTFKKLPAKEYYVHVVKDDKSNIGQGVKVETLEEGRMNKINVVIR